MEEVEVPRTSRQSPHEVDKIVIPMYRPPLHPQEKSLVIILLDVESNRGALYGRKGDVNDPIGNRTRDLVA
jgi:hypothetical protein